MNKIFKIDCALYPLGLLTAVTGFVRNLIKEKQLVALADYYADKISDDNKPLDFESPLRLSGGDKKSDDEGGGDDGGGDSGEQPPTAEPAEGGGDSGGGDTPTFGLGN